VALITQSSNIALNLTMQARGLPLAYVMTVGNQAQTHGGGCRNAAGR
jgi:acyl-CoA synthetase (NDP forming)